MDFGQICELVNDQHKNPHAHEGLDKMFVMAQSEKKRGFEYETVVQVDMITSWTLTRVRKGMNENWMYMIGLGK